MPIISHGPAVAALAIALVAACSPTSTEPVASSAEGAGAAQVAAPVTLEWQQKARALATERTLNPLAAARMFAAVGIAGMRAVETVDAQTGAPLASGSNGNGYGPGGRSRYEARRGAVAGASARVLAWFVPTATASLDAMVAAQGATGGAGRIHPDYARGVAIGQAAADAVIAHVAADRFTAPWNGTFPVGPDKWTTLVMPPGGGMLGQVEPWFLTSPSQFRPAPPPAYLSPAFNADLAQVLDVAANRTPAQIASAIHWASSGGSHMPVGYWNQLAATYVAAGGLDEREAARVFGVLGAATFDVLIAVWEAKYHYWLLRPHQANPALTTVFPVPNYPAYPSGHGGVSAAAGYVLMHYFPDRTAEVNALVAEAAMSRIYAGIHYFFDMTVAKAMAEQVVNNVIQQVEE